MEKGSIGVAGLEEHHGCQKPAERHLYPPSKAISPAARVKPTARSSPPYDQRYTASHDAYHPSSTKIPALEVEGFRRRGVRRRGPRGLCERLPEARSARKGG
ncbi:hypothetical protein MTO96_021455 [Rhipicephalus appendiculatus]